MPFGEEYKREICPHCKTHNLPDPTYKECHNCWEVKTRTNMYPHEVEKMKLDLKEAHHELALLTEAALQENYQ